MQKSVANIITNSNKIDFEFKYNKCKSLEEIDVSLPTLIIGYNNAKRYIKNFNILNKAYPEQKIWWTFLKTEKRVDYDDDILKFNEIVINEHVKDINYSLIDVININLSEIKKIIKYFLLDDDIKLVYNYLNRFLFIYSKKYKTVWGISLVTLRFCGINSNKILNKIYNNENNIKITDLSNIPFSIRKQIGDDIHYQLSLYEYFY